MPCLSLVTLKVACYCGMFRCANPFIAEMLAFIYADQMENLLTLVVEKRQIIYVKSKNEIEIAHYVSVQGLDEF